MFPMFALPMDHLADKRGEETSVFVVHPDRLGCDVDEAGLGEHLDKAALLLLGPPVEPRHAADGHPAIVGGVVLGRSEIGVVGDGERLVRRGLAGGDTFEG